MPPPLPAALSQTIQTIDDETCRELRETLDAVRKELEKTKEELGRSYQRNEARIEELEDENEILRNTVREAKIKEVALTNDNDRLHAEMLKMNKERANLSLKTADKAKQALGDGMEDSGLTRQWQNLVDKKDVELDDMRNILEDVMKQLEEKKVLVRTLEESQQSLEDKLIDHQVRNEELEEMLSTLRSEVAVLKARRSETFAGATLADELGAAGATPSSSPSLNAQNELDLLRAKLAKESERLRECKGQVRKLEARNAKLAERKEEFKTQLATATTKARETSKLAEANKKLTERKEELKTQLATATTKASEATALAAANDKLVAREEKLQTQLATATMKTNEASELLATNKKLLEHNEELKMQLARSDSIVESHKRLAEEKKNVETRLGEQEKKVYELRKVKRQNEKLAAKVASLKSGLVSPPASISSTLSPMPSCSASMNLNRGSVTQVSEVEDLRKRLSDMTRKYHELVKDKRRSLLHVSSLEQQVAMFQKKMDNMPDQTPTSNAPKTFFDMALSKLWNDTTSVNENAASQSRLFTSASAQLRSPMRDTNCNRLTVVSGIDSPSASTTSGVSERERRRAASGVAPRMSNVVQPAEDEDERGWLTVVKKGLDQATISLIRLNGTMQDLVDHKDISGVKARMQTCKDEQELEVGRTGLRLWAAEYLYDVVQDVKSGGDSSLTKLYDAIEDAVECGVNPKLIEKAEKEMARMQKLDEG